MKRFFATITLVAMILIVGCTDLDDLWSEIDSLKKQNKEQADKLIEFEAWLRSVEQLTNTANSDINTIRMLIDALNNKVSVVSYNELADKSGYELSMSDGSKITLKHGEKEIKVIQVIQVIRVIMSLSERNHLVPTTVSIGLLTVSGYLMPTVTKYLPRAQRVSKAYKETKAK